MAEINTSPTPQSNPPDPQVPAATVTPVSTPTVSPVSPASDPQVTAPTTTTVVPQQAPAAVNNPPNPQVPADGSLRIDITTGGPATVNDDVASTLPQPGQGTITPVRVDPAPQVVEIQATGAAPVASGAGITGPISGISPYGEQDDLPDLVQTTTPPAQPPQTTPPVSSVTGPGITGPVDGISPYGEADEALVTDAGATGPGITGPVDGISPYGEEDDVFDPNLVQNTSPTNPDQYEAIYNPETGKFDVINLANNEVIYPDQTEQSAILKAQDLNAGAVGYYYGIDEVAEQADLGGDPLSTQQLATLETARQQQILRAQQKQANQGDWRVKLRLAPGATYLYDDPNDPGILAPLSTASGTGGVVFPYTPQITTSYSANYNSYDLTHSNYRGYFYQNSYVGDIQLQATFTAQDTNEADYLLAVIHFFRSVTKMFYGSRDAYAGTPPPLVFLEGFGQFQFNRHPCVVSQFNYNLPDDVDYIRARSPNISSTNLLFRRTRQDLPTNAFSSAWSRLKNSGLWPGAVYGNNQGVNVPTFGTNSPTYVPTRIDIQLILLPMQTRQQVSQDFNLKDFANGKLIQKGFW